MVAALWLDSNYCGCYLARDMENEEKGRFLVYHTCTKKIKNKKKAGLMNGGAHSVHYFCYGLWISQEMKEIRLEGAADGKTPSYLKRNKHWLSPLTLAHAQVHKPHTGADTHRNFQFAIRPSMVNSPCSPPLSFVFGIKVPPRHKSQILYDIVEIALSKMQSAKAASSADELLWLRKRQWLVSFAPIGSVEGRAQRGPEEVTTGLLHPPEHSGTTFLNVKSAVCYNSSENTLFAKLKMSIQE